MSTLHTHTEKLAYITTRFIGNARNHIGFYHDSGNFFRFTPELKLSTPLDCRRHHTNLMSNRAWIQATVKVKGIKLTLSYPCTLTEGGYSSPDHRFPTSCGELVESLHHHRPRKPLPFAFDDPKSPVVFLSSETMDISSYQADAEWTDPARIVSAVNTFLKRLAVEALTTPEGNQLLSDLDEAVAAARVTVRWLDGLPSEVYSGERDTPNFSSCMTGEDPDWFEIYDDFHRDGRLRMVGLFRGDERVGRALCWKGENPPDMYLDRVYAPGHRNTFDNDVILELKAFCAAEGITKTVFPQTADHFGLSLASRFRTRVPNGKGPDCYGHLPYLDSLRFLSYSGWLHSYAPGDGSFATLTNTDGSAEGRDNDEDGGIEITAGGYRGSFVDEDSAVYIDRLGETYHVDDTTWSDRYDERVVVDLSVEHHRGNLIWEEDAILLHDGLYADGDDDVVELSSGEMALRSDTVTLHDGSVHVLYDIDWVSTVDGEYAMQDDCVRVDGIWYLEGREPQPEAVTETVTVTETETVA